MEDDECIYINIYEFVCIGFYGFIDWDLLEKSVKRVSWNGWERRA